MPCSTVVCLDDLTSDADLPQQACVYDLVRAPIWHASGIDIGHAPRAGALHNADASFRHEDFLTLCGLPGADRATLHHRLPPAAAAFLTAALPASALALGCAMPPWLITLLRDAGQPWLDLRISPLAFGDDAYVELRTEDTTLRAAIEPFALCSETLLTDACLRAAALRRRRRSAPAGQCYDDALVFIPQAEDDPDLIDARLGTASLQAQAEALKALAAQRRLLCLPGAETVRRRLEVLVGGPVAATELPLTELLAMDDTVAFVGLNAAALQQARWYGKEALALWPHGGWLDDDQQPLRVPAHELLSEPLWAALLADGRPRGAAVRLPAQRDRLRRLLGLVADAPADAPAAAALTALPATAAALEIERQRIDDLKLEVEGLKEALRVVLRQTAMRAVMMQTAEAAHG